MPYVQKPPVSKRELINRLLSLDFDGDFRNLGEGARVSRVNAHTVELRFDNIDKTYHVQVHIPLADDSPRRNRRGVKGREEDDFSAPVGTTRQSGTLSLKQ